MPTCCPAARAPRQVLQKQSTFTGGCLFHLSFLVDAVLGESFSKELARDRCLSYFWVQKEGVFTSLVTDYLCLSCFCHSFASKKEWNKQSRILK